MTLLRGDPDADDLARLAGRYFRIFDLKRPKPDRGECYTFGFWIRETRKAGTGTLCRARFETLLRPYVGMARTEPGRFVGFVPVGVAQLFQYVAGHFPKT